MLALLFLGDRLCRVTNQSIDHLGSLGLVVIQVPRVYIKCFSVTVSNMVLVGEHASWGEVIHALEHDAGS